MRSHFYGVVSTTKEKRDPVSKKVNKVPVDVLVTSSFPNKLDAELDIQDKVKALGAKDIKYFGKFGNGQ